MVLKKIKKLEILCIQKLVGSENFSFKLTYTTYFEHLLLAYKKLRPTLSRESFLNLFGTKGPSFEGFIWFLHNFVWDSNKVKFSLSNCNECVFTNWIAKEYQTLSELSIIGCSYTDGKMYFALKNYSRSDLEEIKLTPRMLKYDLIENEKTCYKALKLTVLNYDSLESVGFFMFHQIYFVDLDKEVRFDFEQSLSLLGYPAFKCNVSTHNHLLEKVLRCLNRYELEPTKPTNRRDIFSIVRFVKKSNTSFSLIRACKKTKETSYSYQRLHDEFISCNEIEKAELNLLHITDKQKKSVINNLNENLKSLKLTFYQPICFLLYVGEMFQKLQTLQVRFLSNLKNGFKIFNLERSRHFDKLNNKKLSAFENLKSFKFVTNWSGKHVPFLIDTILNVLKNSQKTLTSFELEHYCYADIKKIIDCICLMLSRNMQLKELNFHYVSYLNYSDIRQIADANKDNELIIKITDCKRVSRNGIASVIDYLNKNHLTCKIEFAQNNFAFLEQNNLY